jgi:hypothetical protein
VAYVARVPNAMIVVPILLLFLAAGLLCGAAQVASALVVISAFALLFVGLPRLWRGLAARLAGGQAAGITRTGLPAR